MYLEILKTVQWHHKKKYSRSEIGIDIVDLAIKTIRKLSDIDGYILCEVMETMKSLLISKMISYKFLASLVFTHCLLYEDNYVSKEFQNDTLDFVTGFFLSQKISKTYFFPMFLIDWPFKISLISGPLFPELFRVCRLRPFV